MKLLKLLVDSALLYGAEVWGCSRQLDPIKRVKMKATSSFLGVGRLHPKVSLLFELISLPLRWQGRRGCIEFMIKVMRMYGWEGMGVEGLRCLLMSEVREMLRDATWREVVDGLREEAGSQSKLVEVRKSMEKECKARSIEVKYTRRRKILAKLKGGKDVAMGRWRGVSRKEWACRNCQNGEVEDVST